jgi:hypothetical protein
MLPFIIGALVAGYLVSKAIDYAKKWYAKRKELKK